MILHLLRALFVLLMAAIGWRYAFPPFDPSLPTRGETIWGFLPATITLAVLILSIDILSSRRKLLSLSGVLAGVLVGSALAFALGYVVYYLVDAFMVGPDPFKLKLIQYCQMLLYVICCYLAISFVLQTKDDIRFIIPYVEFAKQSKGARPMLVDTSALVDGRLADLADLGLIDSRLVIPRFVIDELQTIADSSDRSKRSRGRRGLDIVSKLQANRKVEVVIYEGSPIHDTTDPVDQRLIAMAAEMDGRVVSTDFNLHKVAQVHGVEVINLNEVARALKPVVLPGERLRVPLIKPGEQPGQAVGFLEDGTMVVVEHARQYIGEPELDVHVTSVVQTSAGRMVFGRTGDSPAVRRTRERNDEAHAQPPAEQS